MMWSIIEDINHKIPEDQQILFLGYGPFKHRRIIREYRRLYPEGRKLLYFRGLAFLGAALLLASAWIFGMFR
jgi:hypothetical protein